MRFRRNYRAACGRNLRSRAGCSTHRPCSSWTNHSRARSRGYSQNESDHRATEHGPALRSCSAHICCTSSRSSARTSWCCSGGVASRTARWPMSWLNDLSSRAVDWRTSSSRFDRRRASRVTGTLQPSSTLARGRFAIGPRAARRLSVSPVTSWPLRWHAATSAPAAPTWWITGRPVPDHWSPELIGWHRQAGFELLSTCALALFTAKWWLLGSTNSALAFTPAEVQLLFPAPIRRRTLVLYKIARPSWLC